MQVPMLIHSCQIFIEHLNPLLHKHSFTHQQQIAFQNIVGKGEIARDEQFLLFPQCFLLNQIIASPFVHIFDIISLFAAELEEPKIGVSGKELRKKWNITASKIF